MTRSKQTDGKHAHLTVRKVALADCKPHPQNPRRHPDLGTPGWDALKASLAHDYYDPIVWNERNRMLVSGHLRVKVMTADGYSHADAVIVDYDEPTHLARMLAANKLTGQDDMQAVKDLLNVLDTGAIDIPAMTGYTEAEQERLMTQFHVEQSEKLASTIAGEPEYQPEHDEAEKRADAITEKLRQLQRQKPESLLRARGIVLSSADNQVLLIDDNLPDVLTELRRYVDTGEQSPLAAMLDAVHKL